MRSFTFLFLFSLSLSLSLLLSVHSLFNRVHDRTPPLPLPLLPHSIALHFSFFFHIQVFFVSVTNSNHPTNSSSSTRRLHACSSFSRHLSSLLLFTFFLPSFSAVSRHCRSFLSHLTSLAPILCAPSVTARSPLSPSFVAFVQPTADALHACLCLFFTSNHSLESCLFKQFVWLSSLSLPVSFHLLFFFASFFDLVGHRRQFSYYANTHTHTHIILIFNVIII